MNRNHLWKLLLILFVVTWSLYELFPLSGSNLIEEFKNKAVNRDATFTNIVNQAEQLQKEIPERTFGNLKIAVGTNDITKYFPYITAKGEKDPTRVVLNRLQREAAGKIKLGLDLQGGSSFLVVMDTNKLSGRQDKDAALSHALEVLRRRVDHLGVAEPLLQPEGDNGIRIQLPGLSEAEKDDALKLIQKPAYLEFRMVHPDSEQLLAQGIIDPGYEVLTQPIKTREGVKQLHQYLVSTKAERGLTGKYVKRASVGRKPITNEPEIDFELDSEGAAIFGQITTEYQPKGNRKYQLAIVLDGELQSAPYINEPITGGRGSISGSYELKEAIDLAYVLENPLEAPVHLTEVRSVDPTLGKDSIQSGIKASIIGAIAVAGFMLVYYLFAGAVANVALMLNIVILLGVMCSIGTTLTMPGIAGVVLTIGMAVDANVLIFERIREELSAGKSMRGALSAGYDKAFGTIFDSNLTTLISSVILIFMGTGPVKGFGVTLTIGVTVSMFTALVVTRLIFDWLFSKDLLKSMKMLHIVKGAKFDFMRWAKPAFAASWILIIVGVGYGIHRGRDVLGVEFSGGDDMIFSFDTAKKPGVDQLRAAIGKLGVGDAMIQYQKEMTGGKETLHVTTRVIDESKSEDTGKKVETTLQKDFSAANFKLIGANKVGPTVGKEITKTAIMASLLAMFGILIYVAFRYEFSFAVGAVVAILHDVLMTMGWFFLSGRELSAPFVAAILTIIGFSINDTIVIFDRIREDLKLGIRGTFKEVMNQALNQTLSRTIITSGTVFLATLSLYIFGGGVINDFAFTFLVGIITGTYSSIYIASALVLWWHKGQRPTTGSRVIMETGAIPSRQPADSRV